MNNVGLLYANGHGVKRDYDEAFKWWMRSAERGNAWAMNAVGDLYENGYGVPQNDELALNWYREAAREGDALAMWNIGNLSEQGRGTEQSYAEAAGWYRQSAERGSALGMYSLGKLFQAGRTGTRPTRPKPMPGFPSPPCASPRKTPPKPRTIVGCCRKSRGRSRPSSALLPTRRPRRSTGSSNGPGSCGLTAPSPVPDAGVAKMRFAFLAALCDTHPRGLFSCRADPNRGESRKVRAIVVQVEEVLAAGLVAAGDSKRVLRFGGPKPDRAFGVRTGRAPGLRQPR